jgi:hypothetical protein
VNRAGEHCLGGIARPAELRALLPQNIQAAVNARLGRIGNEFYSWPRFTGRPRHFCLEFRLNLPDRLHVGGFIDVVAPLTDDCRDDVAGGTYARVPAQHFAADGATGLALWKV